MSNLNLQCLYLLWFNNALTLFHKLYFVFSFVFIYLFNCYDLFSPRCLDEFSFHSQIVSSSSSFIDIQVKYIQKI